MKKILIRILVIICTTFTITLLLGVSVKAATNVNEIKAIAESKITNLNNKEEVKDAINELIITVNMEGMSKSQLSEIVNLYKEVSEEYTNEEIADIITENKEILIQNGVKESDINTATTFLKTVNTEQLKNILNTVDLDTVADKIASGESLTSVVSEVTNEMSTSEKVGLVVDILLATNIVKNVLIALVIIFIYRTLLRCVIYKKAGKPAWAPFVPIYRNVVMLKICGISPWVLLLLLVPVIGWIILWIISISSKFLLAESFDRGVVFSFGLWLLPVIFETVLVLSKNIKYVGFEKEEENV